MKQVYSHLTLGDIFLLPIPDADKCHYFVLLASLQESKKSLLVCFSSIKKGLYYDSSCVFDAKDNICFMSGHPLIKQKSCIRYDKAIEMDNSYLMKIKNTSKFCGHLEFSLFNRIIEGAKKTHDMEKSLKIMYNIIDNNFSNKKKVILKRKVILLNQR